MKELETWGQFKGFAPVKIGAQSKDLADTQWVLTCKETDGAKPAKARLVAKGCQDPDLRGGNVDIAGCVGRRSSRLQLLSLGALRRWPIWSLDSENASLQADGFDHEVYLRAHWDWNS